jgi:peptide/nickel transport system substrate-binding protein
VIEEHGDLLDWRNLVGTGPYELVDWVQGSSLTFTKNPNYWAFDEKYPDNRLPYIDEIVWLVMPEESTRLAAFRSGQIDYLGGLSYSHIYSLDVVEDLTRTNPETQVTEYYESGMGLAMNLAVEPTNDLRVRHAVQMALDVEAINDSYWKGRGRATPEAHTAIDIVGYSPPFDEWPEEIKKFYRHDPAEAERLLDAAGYPRGADGIRFKTNIEVRNVYDVNVYEIYAEQLLAVGIDAELQVMETAPWVSNINNKTYQSMTSATVANTWGQLTPLTHSVTGNAWQPAGPVANPEYDALVAAAQNASTLEEQQRASQEALLVMLKNHYYTTAGEAPAISVSQPWVKGFNGEFDLVSVGHGAVVARIWLDPDLKKSLGF